MATGRGDAASMVAVGLVWGATNALMRRGALVWDRRARASPSGGLIRRWAALLLTWQYSAPFATNLCASAAFFALLGAAPISVAVPVTNAVTFAATAVTAAILGKRAPRWPSLAPRSSSLASGTTMMRSFGIEGSQVVISTDK
ncbi:hypothetical protein U9M48_030658, partial [Paspalum notatum var. saurae]